MYLCTKINEIPLHWAAFTRNAKLSNSYICIMIKNDASVSRTISTYVSDDRLSKAGRLYFKPCTQPSLQRSCCRDTSETLPAQTSIPAEDAHRLV